MAAPAGEWLLGLCESARRWVEHESHASVHATDQTPAYVDLIFSFGLARLGEADTSRMLQERARAVLEGIDDAHSFLLAAYSFRIEQAREGNPHAGPLPTRLLEEKEVMERLQRYVVDRLCKHSKILEPDQRIDPYRHWGAKINDLEKALAELTDLTDRGKFAERIEELLRTAEARWRGHSRGRILRFALAYSHRLDRAISIRLLREALPVYDRLPDSDLASRIDRAWFLEGLVRVAGASEAVEQLASVMERVDRAVSAWEPTADLLGALVRSCLRTFHLLRRPEDADQLLGLLDGRLQWLNEETAFQRPGYAEALRLLLIVAEGWYSFRWESKAEPVLEKARSLLFRGDLSAREQTKLACSYAETVGQAPVEVIQKRLPELFEQLRGVRDTYTTSSHFSVSQLDVVEAVVLAAAGDEESRG